MKTIITGFRGHVRVFHAIPDVANIANGVVYFQDRSAPFSDWNADTIEAKHKMLNNTIQLMGELHNCNPESKESVYNAFKNTSNRHTDEWSIFTEFFDNPDVEYLTYEAFMEKYPNDTILQPYDRNLTNLFIGPKIYKDNEQVLHVTNDKIVNANDDDNVEDKDDEDVKEEDDEEDNDAELYDEDEIQEFLDRSQGSPDDGPFDDPYDDDDDEENWHHSSEDSDLETEINY